MDHRATAPSTKHCRELSQSMKLLLLVLFATTSALAQTKTLFYMTDHPDSVRDFIEHQAKIDIIVPTWYSVDPTGLVYGEPDPTVMRAVKQRHISLFPIVAIFDKTGVHTLLTSDRAQMAMIGSLISHAGVYL